MATVASDRTRAPEATIARSVEQAVRADAVILCGSRAIGDAAPTSDYDVFVVLPMARIPTALPRLASAGDELSSALGVPVTLNPLPRFRLRRPGPTYVVWKALHEGRVLSARTRVRANPDAMPAGGSPASSSYAVSGIRYLFAGLDPRSLHGGVLPPHVGHGVRKALLHAAQLQLIALGRYASRLEECVRLLPSEARTGMARHATATDRLETWLAARTLLVPFASSVTSGPRLLAENAQYVAISRLRGADRSLRTLVLRPSVPVRLTRATVLLALAIQPDGAVDQALVEAAVRWLPRFLRPGDDPTWMDVRDVVEREWAHARPLAGL